MKTRIRFEPFLPADLRGKQFAREDNDCVVLALAQAAVLGYPKAHAVVERAFRREPGEGTYVDNLSAVHVVRHGIPSTGFSSRFVYPVCIDGVTFDCVYDWRVENNSPTTLRSILRRCPSGGFILTTPGGPHHPDHAFALRDGVVLDVAHRRPPRANDPIDYVFRVYVAGDAL